MIHFIDAKCMLGLRSHYREGSLKNKEDFLEIMDQCGIDKAIAHHCMAVENDVAEGNYLLIRETNGNSRFLHQWCVMPRTFDEYITPDELVSQMKTNDVSSVRLLPRTCDYSTRPYSIGRLMAAMAQCHVPVFVDASEIGWDGLYQLCTDYAANSIIVTAPGYSCQRQLGPILDVCPNLMVGTSNYVVHGGIKSFCDHYGADRLIFETGMPYGSAAAAVSLILYADISMEEKQKIASENISELLSGVAL